jgi:hypothetical protein
LRAAGRRLAQPGSLQGAQKLSETARLRIRAALKGD